MKKIYYCLSVVFLFLVLLSCRQTPVLKYVTTNSEYSPEFSRADVTIGSDNKITTVFQDSPYSLDIIKYSIEEEKTVHTELVHDYDKYSLCLKDDSFFLLGYSNPENYYSCAHFDSNGSLLSKNLLPIENSREIKKLWIDDNGRTFVFFRDDYSIEIFDSEGMFLTLINDYNFYNVFFEPDDALILIAEEGNRVYLKRYSFKTNEYTFSKIIDSSLKLFYNYNNNSIYSFDGKAIKKIILDNQGKDILLYENKKSIYSTLPKKNFNFCVDNNESIFLYYFSTDKESRTTTVEYLVKSNSTEKQNNFSDENTIVISHSFYFDRFLDIAIFKFEKENPGVNIHIDKVITESEIRSDNFKDIINNIYIRILSGEYYDIVNCTEIDWSILAEKGSFHNLDQYFAVTDIACNILDQLKVNASNFMLPLNYYIPCLNINPGLMEKIGYSNSSSAFTWNDIFEISSKVEKYNTNSNDKISCLQRIYDPAFFLYNYIILYNFNLFFNLESQTSSFNSEYFIDFLEKYKIFIKENHSPANNPQTHGFPLGNTILELNESENFPLWNYLKYITPSKIAGDAAFWPVLKLNTEEQKFFRIEHGFSILQNSRKPELSWNFLETLLADDIQIELMGYPIQQESFRKKSETIYTKMLDISITRNLYDESMDNLVSNTESLIRRLNTLKPVPKKSIEDILIPIFKRFLEGRINSDNTAKDLDSKLKIYLRE